MDIFWSVYAGYEIFPGADVMKSPEYFAVLENLPVGVCVVDDKLAVGFWNRQIEIWSELSSDAVVDRPLTEVLPHLASDDIFIERLKESIISRIPQVFSSRLGVSVIPEERRSGKNREQRTSIVPYQYKDDDYALIVIEDISDLRKEVEAHRSMKDKAIMALNEQLKSEKELYLINEEANLYLEVMSHDLNNYNNVVLGYASLLENSDEDTTRKYARGIVLAAERSFQIIQSVGAVRKLKSNESELIPVSLDNAVMEGIRHYSNVDIDYSETGAKVIADNLLQEVFSNLFGNSIRIGGFDVKIAVIVEEDGGYLIIHVDDNCTNLSDEEKEYVLCCSEGNTDNVGYKLKKTGLPLYIVCKLLEKYGSFPKIEKSSLGEGEKGMRFSFSLRKF